MSHEQLPIVVTGVSSGIGARTARILAGRGVPLIGIDRNPPADFSGTFVQADLSSQAGVHAAAVNVIDTMNVRKE